MARPILKSNAFSQLRSSSAVFRAVRAGRTVCEVVSLVRGQFSVRQKDESYCEGFGSNGRFSFEPGLGNGGRVLLEGVLPISFTLTGERARGFSDDALEIASQVGLICVAEICSEGG